MQSNLQSGGKFTSNYESTFAQKNEAADPYQVLFRTDSIPYQYDTAIIFVLLNIQYVDIVVALLPVVT